MRLLLIRAISTGVVLNNDKHLFEKSAYYKLDSKRMVTIRVEANANFDPSTCKGVYCSLSFAIVRSKYMKKIEILNKYIIIQLSLDVTWAKQFTYILHVSKL